eukprot:gene29960-18025_t
MRLLFKNFKPPSSDVYASGEAGGILNKILRPILPALIIFSMYANLLLVAIAGYRFFSNGLFDPVGILIVVLMLAFALVPIEWCDSDIGFGCMGALLSSLGAILNVKVVMEDEDGLKPGSPCVIGLEPHSALPLALPAIMGYCSPFVPKPLRGRCYALTSSVCFMVPFVRQIFYTAGARPADRKTMQKLLEAGQAVVIVPGGVQECLYMTSNDETAFLKSRQGFVRMALQTGASLVPAFAFNQGKSLHWPSSPALPDGAICYWLPSNQLLGSSPELASASPAARPMAAPSDSDIKAFLLRPDAPPDSAIQPFLRAPAGASCLLVTAPASGSSPDSPSRPSHCSPPMVLAVVIVPATSF